MTIRSWVRKLFTRPVTGPIHKTSARCRLSLESLEARVLPANVIDFGGLRFLSDMGFNEDGADPVAQSGTVSIGYTPAGQEAFRPLLLDDLTQGGR
jgi:hypothetical protein